MPLDDVDVSVNPVQGGLSSTVARVRVRFSDPALRPRTASFIAKTVVGRDVREVDLYKSLLASSGAAFAPRLMGVDRIARGGRQFYLEYVPSLPGWPWSDDGSIGLVMDRLADVHGTLLPQDGPHALNAWDYEYEVLQSAVATVEELEAVTRDAAHRRLRRFLAPVRRLAACLGRMRRALLGAEPPCIIHGDAHPGNVLLRWSGRTRNPVLLDWARARLGSPLEDVSSWLQSLGFWEPAARRRHDTLLRRYLRARGRNDSLHAGFRELYWLARASNAFAGAMRFHLLRMRDRQKPEWVREESAESAFDWGRSIARAYSVWHG